MSLSTSRRRLGGAVLGAALLLSLSTQAQTTAPAWSSAYSLGSGSNLASTTATDAAGNTYLIGSFAGTLTLGGTTLTSVGSNDAYLAKFTSTGALAWIRQLGSGGSDIGNDLALDAAGNVYITGHFIGSISLGNGLNLADGNSTLSKLFVVRYSPQGTPEWAQQSQVGGSGPASGSGIGLDAAGQVHVAGYFARGMSVGASTITTATVTQSGNFLARFAGSSGAPLALTKAFDYAQPTAPATYSSPLLAVAPTGEDYVVNYANQPAIFGGTTLPSRGLNDVLLARYSAQGTLEWVQQLGGTGDDRPRRARTDAAGNLYVAGYFTGPAYFGSTTLPGAGDYDGFLLKCGPQGALQWVQASGGFGSDGFSGLTLDAAGNAYASGNFDGTAQFGPVALSSAGSRDISVAAYSPQGQLRWVQQAGGPGFDAAYDASLDGAGNLLVVGRFEGTSAFGPVSLTAAATSELFLARLGNVLATRPAAAAQALALYPNPATDQLHLPALPAGTPVQLVDALGRVVRQAPVEAGAVPVRGLPAGLYQVRARDAQRRPCTGRVLVQ